MAVFAALYVLFAASGLVAAYHIIFAQANYAKARSEYEELRQYAPAAVVALRDAELITPTDSAQAARRTESGAPVREQSESTPLAALSEINTDFVGWLCVHGTSIDYPVVKGSDNDRYLNTTFTGEKNPSGTIFMDFQCADGFDSPYVILYGHNMKDGSMFAPLIDLSESSLTENYSISVVQPDGKARTYDVFAVRSTEIYDTAFTLIGHGRDSVDQYCVRLGAPVGADILVLSTCTDRDENYDERGIGRFLVFAARRSS